MMAKRVNMSWFVLGLVAALAGCGSGGSMTDVTEYLGKSEEEINELLGDPSGRGESRAQVRLQEMETQLTQEHFQEKRLVYRQEVSPLPKPLVRLDLIISKEGVCKQVLGETTGFDTPEAMLDAIGLGDLEVKRSSRDQLGVTYSIPPYSMVQVHRPSSMVSRYTSFNVIR